MPAVCKVLIVGGGVGGLSAAAACRQQGIDVEIVETNRNHSVYGVGIIQPNNALRALDQIGLADACIEVGAPFSGWDIFGPNGRLVAEVASAGTASPRHPAVNGITRPLLQKMLLQKALGAGTNIRLGVTFKTFELRDDYVDVQFTDGTSGSYDLLIGSDGLYSKMRSVLFPDAPQPHFTGQFVWRYNFERPPEVVRGQAYSSPKAKIGLVPMSPTTMYMFLVTHEPSNPRLPSEDLATLMRGRLSDMKGLIGGLREQIVDPAGVVVRPMENILLPSPWYKGRAILIGDAAHATTPHLAQGAAMAIEDAVLLGELLGRDAPLTNLLNEFMLRRFDRCRHVVESSTQLTQWELESWAGIESPDADPGRLATSATNKLMEAY